MCLTSFDPGGTERQMLELIRRLERGRFEVHVACLHRRGAWLSRLTGHAASLVEFPLRGFARPAALRQLVAFARWCRSIGADVVQTSDFYTNVFALPGAALAGVPLRIGSRRGMNHDRSPAQRRLQRLAYRFAHRVVANSSAGERQLAAEGVPSSRIVCIPNGLDIEPFTAPPLPHRGLRITTVANLRPGKGHLDLLDAAARVVERHPETRVQVVGDGPCRPELEGAAAARGLMEHVRFLGHRDDVPEILRGSDIFVLPSWSEAFPNSVLEAMAAGLPVVATDVDAMPDLVAHECTGLLVPPRNPPALAAALLRLAGDEPLRVRLGRTARVEVSRRYSFDRMVASFAELYSAARSGSAAPATVFAAPASRPERPA